MSSKDVAILVKNLSKCFEIYDRPVDRLKQYLFPIFQSMIGRPPKKYFREFWALNDISFELRRGETLKGRVVALLELGAGFNFEFTGRENIFIYGAILGLSSSDTTNRLNQIIAFAEIGDFIDLPVKTYSSGMFARLAFSIAINVSPDILIVDETLSVGDSRFQQKCIRKINELKQNGCTIILVSHDVLMVKKICESAVLLNSGQLTSYGNVQDVSNKYFELLNFRESDHVHDLSIAKSPENHLNNLIDISKLPSLGDQALSLISLGFFSENNKISKRFSPGERVTLKILFRANKTINNVFLGFIFKDEKGIDIFGCNSLANGLSFNVNLDSDYLYALTFQLPYITNKKYLVDVAASSGTWTDHIHRSWIHDAFILEISSSDDRFNSHTFIGLPESLIFDESLVKIN